MANTTADKLAKLNATKADLKAAINGSGNTVGAVFSAYPAAITSGKTAIAQAITEKGVETEETDTFAQMAANIGQIDTGGPFLEVGSPADTFEFLDYSTFVIWEAGGTPIPILNPTEVDGLMYPIGTALTPDLFVVSYLNYVVYVESPYYGEVAHFDKTSGDYSFNTSDFDWRFFIPKEKK